MGAYLSEPVTDKMSSDKSSEYLSCGASSMQGWRVSQEDAHNCILDFEENSALFAVYDGHGGAEVAQYCSLHLPEFIKSIPAYKSGNMGQALEDAFLDFDATLLKEEVISELKEIAGVNNEKESDEEEEVDDLCAEACMPIEEVLAKYKGVVNVPQAPALRRLQDDSKPLSPYLRAKKDGKIIEEDDSEILSKKPHKSKAEESKVEGSGEACSSKENDEANKTNNEKTEKLVNGDAKHHDDGVKDTKESKSDAKDTKDTVEITEKGDGENVKVNSQKNEVLETDGVKGDSNKENGSNESEDNKATNNNNCDTEKKETKGKGKAIVTSAKQQRKMQLRGARTSALDGSEESDTDDSSDEDVEFPMRSLSDSEEEEEGVEDEEDSEEEEEDSENEEEDEDNLMATDEDEEPGRDSGCTSVVALLRGGELYVANAGDSRCVVSRKGTAIEMSFDHKPEDDVENKRIEKAGGRVTCDGRVNGGLNLSRAIGDHAYKANAQMSAREQMITSLPDIRTLTIDPSEDEFMVLACDGIWNSMTSQEVIDFVRQRLNGSSDKLSSICEELFDHCLSPNTLGDGTGCDNMTCVIVKFKEGLSKLAGSSKRPASSTTEKSETDLEVSSKPKKMKLDEQVSTE